MVTIEEEIEVDVTIGGNSYLVNEAEIQRSRYNEVDTALLRAIPDPDENPDVAPEYDDQVEIEAGSTQYGASDETMRIYTGRVSNRRDLNTGLWKIRCSNAILDLTNDEVFLQTDRQSTIDTFVQSIADQTGVDVNIDLTSPPNIYRGRGSANYYRMWVVRGRNRNIPISFDDSQMTGEAALDKLSESANATWYVDRFNTLQFGPSNTTVHDLDDPYNHVIDTDSGKQTPPYRSVKVIGDSIVSTEGWQGKKLLSESPEVSQGNIALHTGGATPANIESENYEVGTGGLTPPVFRYKNKEIKTLEEAKHVRNKIMNNLQEQQAGGWVEVVGRPNLSVLDIIEMPESFGTTNQGEVIPPAAYLVQKITHRLNDSDGFVTRIKCGGLSGRYEGEVIEEEDLRQNLEDPPDEEAISDSEPAAKDSTSNSDGNPFL